MGAQITAIAIMVIGVIIGVLAEWRLVRGRGLFWRAVVFVISTCAAVAIMLVAVVVAIHQVGSGR